MHVDPTHVIEWLVILKHLDSAKYLSGTFFFYSTWICADIDKTTAFFSLHTDMVFEYPCDNCICDIIDDLFFIADS